MLNTTLDHGIDVSNIIVPNEWREADSVQVCPRLLETTGQTYGGLHKNCNSNEAYAPVQVCAEECLMDE
jgi:hypothetical protein